MVRQDSFEYVSDNLEIKPSDKPSDMLRNAPPKILQIKPCNINGNPKPLSSPQYPDYRFGRHSSELTNAQFLDHIWPISRYIQWLRQTHTDDVCANEIQPCLSPQSMVELAWTHP